MYLLALCLFLQMHMHMLKINDLCEMHILNGNILGLLAVASGHQSIQRMKT